MTTTVTDARTLYTVSADFRSFLKVWEDERHCPIPLTDFLLEHGLVAQAECCRWTTGDHIGIYPSNKPPGTGTPAYDGKWFFVFGAFYRSNRQAHYINTWYVTKVVAYPTPEMFRDTVPDALIWLMDRWKIPESFRA